MVEVSSIKTNMKPFNLQKLEIQQVTILELQAQIKFQNSDLIKNTSGFADEVVHYLAIYARIPNICLDLILIHGK